MSLLSLLALVLPFVHPTMIFLPIKGSFGEGLLVLYLKLGPLINMAVALLAAWRIRKSRGTLKGEEIAWVAFFIDLAVAISIGVLLLQLALETPF